MPKKKYNFLVDQNTFKKLSIAKQGSPDLSVKVDLAKRKIISFRVYMRPLKAEDIDEYYKLYSDATVMEKYCDGQTRSKQSIDQLMSNYLGQEEPSYFSIFQKDTNSFIGTIFLTTRNQEPNEILLGYLIHKDYWGNNYAKEAVYGLLYCFFPIARPQITTVVATTSDDNVASKKILESFNFKRIEEVEKFNQKKLLYKVDVKKIREIHHNIEIHAFSFKKKLGTSFLVFDELLENANSYKYLTKEIFLPILPYGVSVQFDNLLSLVPQDKSYWVSTHFVFSSLGYYFILDHSYSQKTKLALSIISSIGYSAKLLVTEYYQSLSQKRVEDTITKMDSFKPPTFLEDCFHEVALSASLAFALSLPAALSFTPIGLSYAIFSTASSLVTSSLACAASNKHIIESNDDYIISKTIPYLVDLAVVFSAIKVASFGSFNDAPDLFLSIKKTSFVVSSVVTADQITKSIITLIPGETLQYYDSFVDFDFSSL